MKKILALLLTAVMVLGLFAGCAGSATPNETTNAPAQSDTTEASSEAAPEVKDITLKVWGPQEDQVDASSWLPTMCEQFNAAHPEWNITFQYEVCSEGDASKTVTQDTAAAADVYMFANDQLGTLVEAKAIAQLGGTYLDAVTSDNSASMIASVTGTDGGVYGRDYTLAIDLPAMGSRLFRLSPEALHPEAAQASAALALNQKRKAARAAKAPANKSKK